MSTSVVTGCSFRNMPGYLIMAIRSSFLAVAVRRTATPCFDELINPNRQISVKLEAESKLIELLRICCFTDVLENFCHGTTPAWIHSPRLSSNKTGA